MFYVELSSNATEYNTVANFRNRIQLLSPLHGYWEVGIVEISYTKSWKNLRKDFKLCLERTEGKVIKLTNTHYIIKSGHYESVIDLCNEIEQKIKLLKISTDKSVPKFHFDKVTKHISIEPGYAFDDTLIFPNFSEEIAEILGFDDYSITFNSTFNSDKWAMADRPADIDANFHTLYVYSDIVEPQYVGNTRAKLVRTVTVPDVKFGQQIFLNYENPHYVPVLTNEFEYIEIDIKDDTNTRIPFMFGRTRVKLHFKPRNE